MTYGTTPHNTDQTSADDWADNASRTIVLDLRDRKGLGNAFDEADRDIQEEIRSTIADIIRAATPTTVVTDAATPAPETEPPAAPPKEEVFVPDVRIGKSVKTFIEANSTDFNHYVLKDALIDLLEGVMSHQAKQIHIRTSSKGFEIRAKISGKPRVLHSCSDTTAMLVLCATVAASVKDRIPYIPSRRFASIITKTSIDPHGLKFPDALELVQVSIEPLSDNCVYIDMRLHPA
jgi:hypothetical protein